MNNSFINTKSSGFTLIELLVVVAIIGILAAIGIVSYSGYVEGTKKSAENVLQQISLGQTEYYSDNGSYYTTHTGANCSGNATSSSSIETNLLGKPMLLKPITITIFVSQQAHQETNIKYLQQMVLAP